MMADSTDINQLACVAGLKDADWHYRLISSCLPGHAVSTMLRCEAGLGLKKAFIEIGLKEGIHIDEHQLLSTESKKPSGTSILSGG